MSVHMGHRELTTCLLGFAKIRYRDPKLLQSISPAILRNISEFDTLELALLLGAYRRLEYRRIDQIELLMNENPQLRWGSEPFLVGLVLHGMAKVDLRHSGSLKILSRAFTRHCRRYADVQRQETLAVGLNSLARLDWRSRKMRMYAEEAVATRLRRSLELEDVNARTKGRENDTFDMQSLSLLAQSMISLADELPSTSAVLKDLFSLASKSSMGIMARKLHNKEVNSNQVPAGQLAQLRVFKNACQILKYSKPGVVEEMYNDDTFGNDIRAFFGAVMANSKSPTRRIRPRWANEIYWLLKDHMKVGVKSRSLVDNECMDILMHADPRGVEPAEMSRPDDDDGMMNKKKSNKKEKQHKQEVVVECLGPYAFYADSTRRTSVSKLHQRLLELQGYVVMAIPYYEWRELKSLDDKLLYLYSLGRKVYRKIKEKEELMHREAAAGSTPKIAFNSAEVQAAIPEDDWWSSDSDCCDEEMLARAPLIRNAEGVHKLSPLMVEGDPRPSAAVLSELTANLMEDYHQDDDENLNGTTGAQSLMVLVYPPKMRALAMKSRGGVHRRRRLVRRRPTTMQSDYVSRPTIAITHRRYWRAGADVHDLSDDDSSYEEGMSEDSSVQLSRYRRAAARLSGGVSPWNDASSSSTAAAAAISDWPPVLPEIDEDVLKMLCKERRLDPETFICPITRAPMRSPAVACDGHTYDRSAIERWLARNAKSPITGTQMMRRLVPNLALRTLMHTLFCED
ncbi:hypothetical protein FOL47_004475 [Perkinsus chesapeaki]|uniref:U-box domain-containing protein n=1 Tax=Perkinsus chesapeaki TaxID=330153 RepID=A0A7J6M261_PERCH|nr:hypothetical protein FOL47_004475 [Perkinsus chesapeaki]